MRLRMVELEGPPIACFLFLGQATWHSQFQTMPNPMDANKQLHDACPAFHSNWLSALAAW
jgi:hypothetical protein